MIVNRFAWLMGLVVVLGTGCAGELADDDADVVDDGPVGKTSQAIVVGNCTVDILNPYQSTYNGLTTLRARAQAYCSSGSVSFSVHLRTREGGSSTYVTRKSRSVSHAGGFRTYETDNYYVASPECNYARTRVCIGTSCYDGTVNSC